jgi:hypothetical protein
LILLTTVFIGGGDFAAAARMAGGTGSIMLSDLSDRTVMR